MDQDVLDFLAELETSEDSGDRNEERVPAGQRECPICKQKMTVEDEYGVSIDVCPEHGAWLDRGELRAIIGRIRSGERISRQTMIRKAKKDGKISGVLFGVWSLLLD
jgi:Zn-finger nucleic acid-binding protein